MEYKDRLFVESLERGFGVLRAFEGHESLGLAEIAEKAGITRSAAQRFTHTLEVLGFLRRDAARRWRLTPRTLEFGTYYLAADPLIAQATPHLVDLNNDCGETVNLSRPDALDMVFLGRFTANRRSFIHMPQGMRVPMYCGATGRAYLATLPREQREAVTLREISGLDYAEIAAVTGAELGTVKSRINRGRAALREWLTQAGLKP